MLEAFNNFNDQGKNNFQGWGIGYYCSTQPQVGKECIDVANYAYALIALRILQEIRSAMILGIVLLSLLCPPGEKN
jgi:predicted glutamine amidotransferase